MKNVLDVSPETLQTIFIVIVAIIPSIWCLCLSLYFVFSKKEQHLFLKQTASIIHPLLLKIVVLYAVSIGVILQIMHFMGIGKNFNPISAMILIIALGAGLPLFVLIVGKSAGERYEMRAKDFQKDQVLRAPDPIEKDKMF